MLRNIVIAAAAALFCSIAVAGEAQPVAEDPVLEERVNRVGELLRCLVCQNQTIADSNADLAVDLKNEIRDMMRKGQTDEQIVDFMVARYGDFVLYKPQVKSTTWLLWFGPGVLLVAGIGTLFFKLRKRASAQAAPPELSDEQRERAYSLLNNVDTGDAK